MQTWLHRLLRAGTFQQMGMGDRVSDKRHATPEHIKTLTCPYAVNGRCEIYEQRPLICRLFGAVDAPLMTCPHGCGPVGKLTDEQAGEMMRIYTQELIDK